MGSADTQRSGFGAAASPLVVRNRERFASILARASSAYRKGDYLGAAAFAQLASDSAWSHHPGFYFSSQMEGLLRAISEHAIAPPRSVAAIAQPQKKDKKKVLHVLTQALPIGGHTRFVCNWMRTDSENEHHVALTQQNGIDVPTILLEATRDAGGSLGLLDVRGRGLLDVSIELSKLAAAFDLIVLHLAPSDVIPCLAFGASRDHPPIASLIHADHLFSSCVEIPDIIISFRKTGLKIAESRRGVTPERNALLPIPLIDKGLERLSRQEARKRLGIPEEEFVMLSVASQWKYRPNLAADFCKTHLPILQSRPNSRLIVIGPRPDDEYWQRWTDLSGGRIQALGPKPDTDVYLAAADIYCDSMPVGSLTSILEAGIAGLPCVSLRSPEPQADILSSDDPAFPDCRFTTQYADPETYRERIEELFDDSKRLEVGRATRDAFSRWHVGTPWLAPLHHVYERCSKLARERPTRSFYDERSDFDTFELYDDWLATHQAGLAGWMPVSRLLPLRIRLPYLLEEKASLGRILDAVAPVRFVRGCRTIWHLVK